MSGARNRPCRAGAAPTGSAGREVLQDLTAGADTCRVRPSDPARARGVVRALLVCCLLGLVVGVVAVVRGGLEAPVPAAVRVGVPVVAALVCLLQAAASPSPWACRVLAAGVVVQASGRSSATDSVLSRLVDLPEADRLVLLACVYSAMLLLLRAQLARWHPSLGLDGLVALAGAAAVVVALLGEPLAARTGTEANRVAVHLAAPAVTAFLLLAALVGLLVSRGGIGRVWTWWAAALAVLTANGVGFVLRAEDVGRWGDVQPGPLGLGRLVVVLLLLGAVSTSRPAPPELRLVRADVLLAVPAVCSAASLTVLFAATRADVPAAAEVLALVGVVLALVRVALTFREVTAAAELRHQVLHDDLTGCASRRAFLGALAPATTGARRTSSVAVLLCDLDRFKEVNDTLGHAVGDDLLRAVAARFGDALPPGDVLARLGGDEFAVLARGADVEQAVARAEALRRALAGPLPVAGTTVHVDVSVGVAVAPHHASGGETLLQRADLALYEAKGRRSGVEVYRSDLDVRRGDALRLTEDLRGALETDAGLVLHYQPQVDLRTGRVRAVEALVRWQHPERGLLAPDVFLPLVARANLHGPLATRVLALALAQARRWRADGHELPVAVNLSPPDLLDVDLPRRVGQMLAAHDVPASLLHVEVTEETFLADRGRARRVLEDLAALGVRVALDDYGSGWSSLAYLRELPVQELKLDRSFARDLASDPVNAVIVSSTVGLAHSLGLVLVVEGVETASDAAEVTAAGCDVGQGWFWARPAPADALAPLLRAAGTGAAGPPALPSPRGSRCPVQGAGAGTPR